MSILGAGGLPALGLASSTAAAQQRSATLVDRDKADQEIQKLQSDQVRLNNRDLDDSIETDFSHGQVADRDSDGRLPWQASSGHSQDDQPADEQTPHHRVPNPDDETGGTLDVEV